jgi:hypothetical protein
MSQRVWTCAACGWRGVSIGGAACQAGRAPQACGSCGSRTLSCTSEHKLKVTRVCIDCQTVFLAGATSRFCPVCRWRHRGRKPKKYLWTLDRDRVLRERYDGKIRNRSVEIARAFGWPTWVIKKRAGILGLCYPIDKHPWRSEEIDVLDEWTGRKTSNWIAKRLHRSEASVILKQKRLHMSRRIRDGYTLRDLEMCFGCDHHSIERWVREGKLQIKRRGTARVGKQGDVWKVTDADVKGFIQAHPTAFRLDKVDQVWFLDLVFGTRHLGAGAGAGDRAA